MIEQPPPWAKHGFDFVIDWQESFREFCLAHGDPVIRDGKLLFPDGWSHAMDHRGPETAPPAEKEELRKVLFAYWDERRKMARGQAGELANIVETLQGMLRTRSAPVVIARQVMSEGPDGGLMPRVEQERLSLETIEPMIDRLKELKMLELEAERRAKEFKRKGADDERADDGHGHAGQAKQGFPARRR